MSLRRVRPVSVLAFVALLSFLIFACHPAPAFSLEHRSSPGVVVCDETCRAQVTWYWSSQLTLSRQWFAGVVRYTPHAVCVREHESAHGYSWPNDQGYMAQRADGQSASGAYGFVQKTADNVNRALGRPDLIGVRTYALPWWDQDLMYAWLYAREGDAPWLNMC